jgi:hypothetical protein
VAGTGAGVRATLGEVLGIAIEPTYFDLERCRVDPEGIVAMAARCHANTLRFGVFSHQGQAYYPSQIAPHAPGLDGQDLLRDFQAACRVAGMTLAVYMNSKYDTQKYHERPDWAIRHGGRVPLHEAEADLQIYPMCPNSPYLDYFASLLREVASRYGPEILYIDNFGMSIGCECRFCAEAYREASGRELPAGQEWGDPLWQAYRVWSRERSFALGRLLVGVIRSARPGTLVVFNRGHFRSTTGHGNPEDVRLFAREIADNVHGESAVRFYGQSFAHIDEQCAFGRAIEAPLWTWVEYPLQPWSHVASPPAEVRIKAAKVLANGGRPMVWTVPRAPDCDERGLEGLADVYGLASRFPEYFNGTTHLPFAAVLCSSRTMEEYCRGDAARFADCQKELSGALSLFRHNHLPCDILLDDQVTASRLARYRVMVLPNAAALCSAQCAAIGEYVGSGGGLMATFESSLYDELGRKRPDFGLADVLGVHLRTELPGQSLRWVTGYSVLTGEHPAAAGLGEGFRLPAGGRCLGVAEAGRAARVSTMMARCRYYCDHPGRPTEFAGLVAGEVGKGRVLYAPWQLGLVYEERGFPDYRRIVKSAAEWMCRGELPLWTSLPDTVHVTLTSCATGAVVVHLVNCSADLSRPVERVVPVCGERISVRLPGAGPRDARALVAGESLRCDVNQGVAHIALPDLHEYEVIVIR